MVDNAANTGIGVSMFLSLRRPDVGRRSGTAGGDADAVPDRPAARADASSLPAISIHIIGTQSSSYLRLDPSTGLSGFRSARSTDVAGGERRNTANRKGTQDREMFTLRNAAPMRWSGGAEDGGRLFLAGPHRRHADGARALACQTWSGTGSTAVADRDSIDGTPDRRRLASQVAGNVPLEILSGYVCS